jgi:Membrane domain of glycerophosphoryl diester phosphodiesterase
VVLLSLLGTAGAIFAISLAVFGLIAIGILAVWLVTKVALVPCAVVLEKLPIRLAVRRSWSLTQGNFWKTFGVIALIFLIVSVVQEIVTAPVSLIGGFAAAVLSPTSISPDSTAALTQTFTSPITIIASIVGIVVGAILYVAQASAVSLLYIDLRMRKEGLDLKLVRYVEARQTGLADVPDPFVPEKAPPFEPAPPQGGAPTL